MNPEQRAYERAKDNIDWDAEETLFEQDCKQRELIALNRADIEYAANPTDANRFTRKLLNDLEASGDEHWFVGFDTEGLNDVFQLYAHPDGNRHAIVYQVKWIMEGKKLPQALSDLLNNPRVIFVGKKVGKELLDLFEVLEIPRERRVSVKCISVDDLVLACDALSRGRLQDAEDFAGGRAVSTDVIIYEDTSIDKNIFHDVGIRTATNYFLNRTIDKRKKHVLPHLVDWSRSIPSHESKKRMTKEMLVYAATDAWVPLLMVEKAAEWLDLTPYDFARIAYDPLNPFATEGLRLIVQSIKSGDEAVRHRMEKRREHHVAMAKMEHDYREAKKRLNHEGRVAWRKEQEEKRKQAAALASAGSPQQVPTQEQTVEVAVSSSADPSAPVIPAAAPPRRRPSPIRAPSAPKAARPNPRPPPTVESTSRPAPSPWPARTDDSTPSWNSDARRFQALTASNAFKEAIKLYHGRSGDVEFVNRIIFILLKMDARAAKNLAISLTESLPFPIVERLAREIIHTEIIHASPLATLNYIGIPLGGIIMLDFLIQSPSEKDTCLSYLARITTQEAQECVDLAISFCEKRGEEIRNALQSLPIFHNAYARAADVNRVYARRKIIDFVAVVCKEKGLDLPSPVRKEHARDFFRYLVSCLDKGSVTTKDFIDLVRETLHRTQQPLDAAVEYFEQSVPEVAAYFAGKTVCELLGDPEAGGFVRFQDATCDGDHEKLSTLTRDIRQVYVSTRSALESLRKEMHSSPCLALFHHEPPLLFPDAVRCDLITIRSEKCIFHIPTQLQDIARTAINWIRSYNDNSGTIYGRCPHITARVICDELGWYPRLVDVDVPLSEFLGKPQSSLNDLADNLLRTSFCHTARIFSAHVCPSRAALLHLDFAASLIYTYGTARIRAHLRLSPTRELEATCQRLTEREEERSRREYQMEQEQLQLFRYYQEEEELRRQQEEEEFQRRESRILMERHRIQEGRRRHAEGRAREEQYRPVAGDKRSRLSSLEDSGGSGGRYDPGEGSSSAAAGDRAVTWQPLPEPSYSHHHDYYRSQPKRRKQ